jgi:DNA-binding PadR family transcriptional regulator
MGLRQFLRDLAQLWQNGAATIDSVLRAALWLLDHGEPEANGSRYCEVIRDLEGRRWLPARGNVYLALARLQEQGLILARWEAPAEAAAHGGARRRRFRLSETGRQAAAALGPAST